MSQNKGQGDGGSRRQTEKTSNAEPRPAAPVCPSCDAVTLPDARYCHICGKPLHDQPAHRRRDPVTVALFSIIGIAIVGSVAAIVYVASDTKVAAPLQPMMTFDSAPVRTGQSVDLSTMSPREAADRLFNRIMTAEEQGDKQEAMRFMPMALQAYQRVDILDADAHYHIGLLHIVAGDFGKVLKQVEILKQFSPGHLLGLFLEHTAAEQSGDTAAAAEAAAAFAAAYDSEIAARRPEYEAHRNSIEKFHAKTAGGATLAAPTVSTAGASRGAALFASKCAGCHGQDAAGSNNGPPLVHRTYEPSLHGDDAFYRAVREGAKSHHWPYGNMPPIAGVSDDEIARIISYVRAKQVASGIR